MQTVRWMNEAGLYARGLGGGKRWRKIREEVRARRSKIIVVEFAKATMTFHYTCKVNNRDPSRIEAQLEKLTKQLYPFWDSLIEQNQQRTRPRQRERLTIKGGGGETSGEG